MDQAERPFARSGVGPPASSAIAERDLQRGWAAAPPVWLEEDSGRRWRVLFAGTWNHGPGPDFRDAVLLPSWGPALRGDVEIHQRLSGWRAHGHDTDPGYAGVSFELCAEGAPGQRCREATGAALPPRTVRLRSGPTAAAPPCVDLVARAGENAVEAALRRLSRERLLAKASRLGEDGCAADWTDAEADGHAYAALMGGLGAGSLASIAALPQRLPWPSLRQALQAGDSAALATRLTDVFAEGLGDALPGTTRGSGGRPANRPEKRLAAAAQVLLRLVASGDGSLARGVARLASLPEGEAIAALQVPRLLGRERARQLLVDAVYPFALAREGGSELVARWQRLGGARYGRTDPLRARLAADGLRVWANGQTQALLSLESCYCRAGACAVCPLARVGGPRPHRSPLPSPNAPEALGTDVGEGRWAHAPEARAGPGAPARPQRDLG
ncbi:MAG: Protein of unknown function (DUF2851) [Chloroflexi bacterium]|nr:MAG: Protein of unknown function (DUF2851) [Chloroflexota bacterium]